MAGGAWLGVAWVGPDRSGRLGTAGIASAWNVTVGRAGHEAARLGTVGPGLAGQAWLRKAWQAGHG